MKKTLLAALLSSSIAWALPEGGQIIQGNLQIVQPNAHILQILQSSPTGIINWGSFNIDPHQLVQFLQPNSSAATLNRVIGQEPSQILGQLQANGRILLINPNGILFGPGSIVDTGSFLASTLSIQDQDFLQGRYDLHWDGTTPLRAIVNQGEIRVGEGGFLALISPLVDNQGMLLAERGQVVLGATRQATLTVDARGLLQVVIADGFHGTPSQPQTVLLTQGQMSDTLAQVVHHYAGSEAGAIVETPQGVQLVGGEGLLVNSGQIRADAVQGNAGSVRLDSSQATVLTPQSVVSASSAQGAGGDLRILSAGDVYSRGDLLATGRPGGFVEVSAPSLTLTRGAEVSGGVFLLDPDNIFVQAGGGDSPDIFFGGSGDAFVDPSALNVTGSVILQANQDLVFTNSAQVNIDRDTQLQLAAGRNFVMDPASFVNATASTASVNISATGSADLWNLRVPQTHVSAGTFARIDGGTFGQPGTTTVVNISAPQVSFDTGATANLVGSDVNLALLAGQDISTGANSRINLLGTTSNNVSLTSGTSVGIGDGSLLTASGPTALVINAGTFFSMGAGSQIAAQDPGSTLQADSGTSMVVTNLLVPTSNLNAQTFMRFDGGAVGVSGTPTTLNVSAHDDITTGDNSLTTVLGSTTAVNLTSPNTVRFGTNSTLAAEGTSRLDFNAGTDFFMFPDSALVAANPGSLAAVNATGAATLRSFEVPTSHINAGTFVQFNNGTLGQSGSDTLVNVSAGDGVFLFAGSTLNVVGDRVEMDLLATGNSVFFGERSLLQLAGQTSNVLLARSDNGLLFIGENTRINSIGPSNLSFNTTGDTILQRNGGSINVDGAANISMVAGVNVILQATSGINATGAGSRLDVDAGHNASIDGNTAVPIVNVTANDNLDIAGSLGRPEGHTQVDARAGNVTLFSTDVTGNQIDWNLTSTVGDIAQVNGSTLRIQGSNNHVNWNGNGNVLLGNDTLLTASGPTQLQMTSGQRTLQLSNSTISLPDAASNLDIHSAFSPALNRVQVGGRLAVTASGGNNIRIADQLEANDIILTSPGQLLDDRTDNTPAIIAHNSLNVTVANISGPLTDPNIGLVQALPFATGPNAQVRFNLTGPNNTTTLGNRSANLFYAYPQSGDVIIVHPLSDVALYNEPAPVAATHPIQTRDDLSPQQFQAVTSQSAQAQVQLSSLYSVADLPASDNVLLLEYDNAGLTDAYSISYMVSALVERVVLSPEQAVQARRDREKRESERPTSLVVSGNDEDEELRYWRRLIEGIILWEE